MRLAGENPEHVAESVQCHCGASIVAEGLPADVAILVRQFRALHNAEVTPERLYGATGSLDKRVGEDKFGTVVLIGQSLPLDKALKQVCEFAERHPDFTGISLYPQTPAP